MVGNPFQHFCSGENAIFYSFQNNRLLNDDFEINKKKSFIVQFFSTCYI